MKIFLIRHGESTSDVEERYGGHYDDHLTGKGEVQSRKVAKKLAGKGIEMIFTSPFLRARETSNILSKEWKCPVKVVEGLKERDRYAHLTGMKKSEAAKRHPHHARKLKNHLHSIEGGEEYGPFRKRIEKVFDEIANSKHETIAIVCHGGPIGCILRDILKVGETKYIGKCAFFEILNEKVKLSLIRMENAELEKSKRKL